MECIGFRSLFYIAAMIFLSASTHFVHAVELLEEGNIIVPDRTSEAIKIDGDLSEHIWSSASISENFFAFLAWHLSSLVSATGPK